MGEPIPIGLPSGSNQARSGLVSSTRLVNCYRETNGSDAKSGHSLVAVNGWESYATLPGASGGVRAMLSLDSELLVVAGRQFYRVSPSQAVTPVGGIPSDGLVTMARNRQAPNPQAVIVADGQWYIYQGGSLAIGSDSDLETPIYVVEHNGYFVFISQSGRFTISGIDKTTIDGLDFATAQSDADFNVGAATRGDDLLIFGERSTEFWRDDGGADFPFTKVTARGYGCYSAGSISEITAQVENRMVDSVVWCATDEKGKFTGVYLLAGYEAQKISTYEIDRAIEKDANPQNLRGFSWSENGHNFYTITGSSYSYTYDVVEGQWHERRTNTYDYWAVSAHATFDRKTIFGSSLAGTLYRSDIDLYQAGSDSIQMEVQIPITHAWPYNVLLNRVVVDAVTGVGLNTTDEDYADPEVIFDMSLDGGVNYTYELHRSIGRQGQTLTTMDWWGLGLIPRTGTVLRFRLSPGVKRILMGVAVDVERLAA